MHSASSSTTAATATDPARLIDELKRIAVEQLGAVPGGLYAPIEEQLQDKLRLGAGGNHRRDLVTVLALRQRSSSYVMRFRELIAYSFDDFRGHDFLPRHEAPMDLVHETELDFHLAGQHLADSIGRRYQRSLEMLNLRFEALANALGVLSNGNPVGSLRLAGAFLQVFRDADISETLQPLLFRQYEQELGKVLGDLYRRLNTQLASHGFHADIRVDAAGPAGPVPQGQPATAPAQVGTSARPMGPAGADLFRVSAEARVRHQRMRDLLHVWRQNMCVSDSHGPAVGEGPDERHLLQMQEVLSVVSLIQNEGFNRFDTALAGNADLNATIREELLEGARRLGLDPGQTRLDPQQEDAVDLTGLLFESMLRTHSLVAHSRRLFARLVMSYVKVALTDENLFVRPDHPARRLLDALALSCESNDGASPQDQQLLERAAVVVDRVVAEYNEDLAVFELAANELNDLLQQQRRRAEIVERRSAETVYGRERLLQARLQAAAALNERISSRELTPAIAQFLECYWQHHLVQVLLREGHASQRHAEVLALADELVAIDDIAARGVGAEVAERVMALYEQLVECLSSSGLDDKVASEWMAGLARTLAFPDTARSQHPQPAMPQMADDSDDTRLLQVVAGDHGLDFDPEIATRLRGMSLGIWMRLLDEDGNEGSVKLAWISPLTSRLLLVDRRGVRKLVASPEQLAALARTGHLLADVDELPFDEAMRQVRQRLGEAVAQAA